MDYRYEAKQALERAKIELSSNEDERLKYAALELRMALEGLIYSRAENYQEELSEIDIGTWQPKKLLMLLLEIDPFADKSSTLSAGLEEEYGKPAPKMQLIGTSNVLSLGDIKKYYDKLGSYLHLPTIPQAKTTPGVTPDKIKKNCLEVQAILEKVFSSNITNSDFATRTEINCNKCGATIVRRVPHNEDEFIAKCIKCPATYTIVLMPDNQVQWTPRLNKVECAHTDCDETINIWERELELGKFWSCTGCGGKNTLVMGIAYSPKGADQSTEN